MSKFVDERVVEMSFDNKRFESNVKTSMGTIEKLKNSLDFSGTSKNINRELSNINTNGVSTALLSAKNSFTALEIAAIASIANITNRIIDLGIQMVKSLSVDNISSGWQQFSKGAISEATLLAQGFEQSDIDKYLELITWYTDETSHNLAAMTDGLSKFTGAGFGLEESAKALIGIGNWASVSGREAGDAAIAITQLNQALGKGYIQVQDWMSIERLTMDTEEFKQKVLDTAVAMGTLIQNIDGSYTTLTGKTMKGVSDFRNFLSEDFFTSDVLMNVLNDYAGGAVQIFDTINESGGAIQTSAEAIDSLGNSLDADQLRWFLAAQEARNFAQAIQAIKDAVSSGWMNIFKRIFGQVEEAKILWGDLAGVLYDVFMGPIWKKIGVLDIWADAGGRNDLFENTEENTGAFWNLFNAVLAIKDLIGGSWQRVFGFSDLEGKEEIADIANKLKTFTENLKEWTEGLTLSSDASEILTNIFTGMFSVLKILGKTIIAVWQGMQPLVDVIKPLLGYLLSTLGIVGKEITEFSETTTVFENIANGLKIFFTSIIEFVKSLEILEGLKSLINTFSKSMKKVLGNTDTSIDKMSVFKKVIETLSNAFSWLGNILKTYVLPVLGKVLTLLATGLGWAIGHIAKFVFNIGNLINSFKQWSSTNTKFQNGLNKTKQILSIIGAFFVSVTKKVNEFFKSFGKANTKPVDDFSGDVEEKFTPLKAFVEGLKVLLEGLWNVIKAVMGAVGSLFGLLGKGLKIIGEKLKSIFTTGDGEVNFKKLFSVGFWAVVAVGIYRFADMLSSITDIFKDAFNSIFDYFNSKAMRQYMDAIRSMAISILLLVGALVILGSMDTDVLTKSMITLSVLIGFLVGVMYAMKQLVKVEFSKMGKDFTRTGVNMLGLGVAFVGLAAAILIMSIALKMLTKLDPSKMMYGLGIIAIMFGMMIGVMKIAAKDEKGTNKAVRSMVKVAISIALLVRPLKTIGAIDPEQGIRGLIGIAALMGIITLYSRFAKPIEKSQKSVYGLISTAIALNLLIIPLKSIGKMSWNTLIKSGVAIVSLFAILTVASKVLTLADIQKLQLISGQLVKVAFSLTMFAASMALMGAVRAGAVIKSLVALGGIMFILAKMNTYLGKNLTSARVDNMRKIVWSLIPLSIALGMLGIALKIVGSNKMDSVFVALVAFGGVLAILAWYNTYLDRKLTQPRVSNMSKTIWSLIPLAISIGLFGAAIKFIGSIPWTTILVGLSTVFVVFGMLAMFDKVLQSVGGGPGSILAISASMVILAGGLLFLSIALLAIGSVPIKALVVGLGTIVAVLAVLAIVAWALTASGTIAVIMALAITFAVFAVSVFLVAAALTMAAALMTISSAAFAAGLIAISTALIVAAPIIMKALWTIVEGVLQVVIQSIPLIIQALELLTTELWNMIGRVVPIALEAIKQIVIQLIDNFKTIYPLIYSTILEVIAELLTSLANNAPIIGEKLFVLLDTILDFLIKKIPELQLKVSDLLAAVLIGAMVALTETNKKILKAAFDLIIKIIDELGVMARTNASRLRTAMLNLAENIWYAFLSFFGLESIYDGFKDVGKNVVNGISSGINSAWKSLEEEFNKLLGKLPQWARDLLGIKSPSRVFAEIGKYVDMGLAQGIEGNTGSVYNATNALGDEAVDGIEQSGLSGALLELSKGLESDFDNEVVIRPVLDLSEIQNGKTKLRDLLTDIGPYDISGSNRIASSTRDDINKETRRSVSTEKGNNTLETVTPSVINNTFNITGSNAKDIADEVSRVLQIQIDRRRANNGMVKV